MSKYVRTEDGVITVTQFAIYLLGKKYNAGRVGVSIDSDGKIEYQYAVTRKERAGRSRRSNSICFRTAYFSKSEDEVLKMVEETPNRKADTIEELCDCYLDDYGKGMPVIITKDVFEKSIWAERKALRKDISVYACIVKRDGKGTHIEPVEKKNKKGELESLWE